MKKIFAFAFVMIFGVTYGAKSIEDLKLEVKNASTVEQAVHATINISYRYSRSMPDTGLAYGMRGLRQAIEHNLEFEEARANTAISINYLVKSQHHLALEFQFKALRQFEDMDSLKQVAGAHSNISLILMNQSDYRQAMEYALKALAVYDKTDEIHNKGIIYENIGILLYRQDDLAKAKTYYQKAFEIFLLEKDSSSIARNRSNVGMVLYRTGKYDEAEITFKESLAFNRKKGNKRSIQINQVNLGLLEFKKQNYEKALSYLDSAQAIAKEVGMQLQYANGLGNIGEVYVTMANAEKGKLDKKMLQKGISHLEEGINLGLALGSPDPSIGFYEALSEGYALNGEYKKSLEIYKTGEKLKDSVHSFGSRISLDNMEVLQRLAIVDSDLQSKSQELKIKSLELNKTRQTIALYIMGLVILILAGMGVVYQLRKAKLRNKKLIESNEFYASKIEEQLTSLKKHATVLDEITYMQAHHVREPVATILGMVEHFNTKNPQDPMNKFVIENLTKVTEKLDVAVREVISKNAEVGKN